MDREKVLQALEHCDICSDMPNCPGCAYLREPDCMEHLKRDIIALLKAQEPVEPYTKRDGRTTFFLCGGCNKPLCIAKDSYKPKHCPECGREVKWA